MKFVYIRQRTMETITFRVFYIALSNAVYEYRVLNVFAKRRKRKRTRHLSPLTEEKRLLTLKKRPKTIKKRKIKISGSVCNNAYFYTRSIVLGVRKKKEIKNVRVINVRAIQWGESCLHTRGRVRLTRFIRVTSRRYSVQSQR